MRTEALGREKLLEQLYANPHDLEVSPRRRKFISITNSIAAAATGYVVANIAMDAADQLQAGDGVLFDFVMASAAGNQLIAANNLLLQGMALYVRNQGGTVTSQPLASWRLPPDSNPLAPQNVSTQRLATNITPKPRLWTSRDFNFQLRQQPITLPAVDQPLVFLAAGYFTNNGAAANTVQIDFMIYYRIVRGLQEG